MGLLLTVQHAALQMLRQSAATELVAEAATPLLDLNSVDIQLRDAGRRTMSLHAARFVLMRDLRTISVGAISGGVAYNMGRPVLLFAAGRAVFDAGMGGISSGWLHLDNGVSVNATALHFPVKLTTAGIDWQWPKGEIVARGSVNARVGTLGEASAAILRVDPSSRSAEFTNLTAVADSKILPLPTPVQGKNADSAATGKRVVFKATEQTHWDDQRKTLATSGPVTVREGDVEMRTVGAIYDQTVDVARALSPVTIIDDKNTLTGDHGSIDFKTHIATLDGSVEMSATPTAPAPGKSGNTLESQTRKPTRMFCAHIVYNYRTKVADATGNLKIVQTDRVVTALKGTYDTNAQMIALDGDVDGHDSDGKHLIAPAANISVDPKNEYIDVKGPIEYEFPVSGEDNPVPPVAQSSGAKSTAPDKPSAIIAPKPIPPLAPSGAL
jgi:hypothetical protein